MAIDVFPMAPSEMYQKAFRPSFSIPIIPGKYFTGAAPKFEPRYGSGKANVGFHLPIANSHHKEYGGDDLLLGNPTLDGQLMLCFSGSFDICVGGMVAVGLGLWKREYVEWGAIGASRTLGFGTWAHQSFLYYTPKSIILRPATILYGNKGFAFFEAQLGVEVVLPVFEGIRLYTEPYLSYKVRVGAVVPSIPMVLSVGVTGLTYVGEHGVNSDLNEGEEHTAAWANLGLQIQTRFVQPFLRLGIALNETSMADHSRYQVGLGLSAAF